jgi:glycyl-tRNA synthetase
VIEPSFGVDRTVYTLLAHAYRQDEVDGEERTYLSLSPAVAPTDVGVFPLVSNVPDLVDRAKAIVEDLRAAGLDVAYDDSGSIGRRYRRQDEVGTPFCITIDRDGLEGEGPDTATIRERDTARQVRVPIDSLVTELQAVERGETAFDELVEAYELVAPGTDA